jgi:hypothetical protein
MSGTPSPQAPMPRPCAGCPTRGALPSSCRWRTAVWRVQAKVTGSSSLPQNWVTGSRSSSTKRTQTQGDRFKCLTDSPRRAIRFSRLSTKEEASMRKARIKVTNHTAVYHCIPGRSPTPNRSTGSRLSTGPMPRKRCACAGNSSWEAGSPANFASACSVGWATSRPS